MKNRNNDEKSLMDLVAQDTRLTKFNQMVKLAGLAEHLAEGSGLTLFAPTNEAFALAAQDKLAELTRPENRVYLRKFILLHVMPKALTEAQLKPLERLRSEAGFDVNLAVSPDLKEITLDRAQVSLPRADAKNGYMYPTNHILRPAAAVARAAG